MSLAPVDDFFLLNDFATEALYKDASGITKKINVIFDEKYSETRVGSDVYENLAPIVHCKTTDVTGITVVCTFKIGSITYKVVTPQFDIQGVTSVILSQDGT